jgi:hypothetical protein
MRKPLDRVRSTGEAAMYDIVLIILGTAIVFLVVRIVIKVRALSGTSFDEEDLSGTPGAQLSKELRDLKVDDPQAENWDSEHSAGQDRADDQKPPVNQP